MNIIDITPVKQENNRKIRLAPYCRVSSDSEDQRHSFATQIRYYCEYTQKHPEYEIVDIYSDEGITGTEIDKRDDFLRLLRDCKQGKIDRIITKSVSRFARNTMEMLETLRTLKQYKVSVYFEEQGIDTNKLNMEMFVTFPGIVAQQESESISGNVRWGIQKRMQAGDFICVRLPFGYEYNEDGEIIINIVEAAVIQRIFNLYLQGMGMQSIATLLNAEKVPKRYGTPKWLQPAIKYILTNERYVGDARLQKQYTTETLPYRRKTNKGERPQYYVENNNPAIIERETFDAVQKLLKSRKNEPNARNVYLLSKMMRCPECGSPFRRQEIKGKAYWICMKKASRAGDCQNRRVREDMVYETFVGMLYKLKNYREVIIEDLIKKLEILQNRTSKYQESIQRLDREIADLAAKNLVITRLHTNGLLGSAEFSVQIAEVNNKINELRAERKRILSESEDTELEELKELRDILKEYQPCNQFESELFEQFVKGIIVNDNTQLTFQLLGGLQLTEEIRQTGRCKKA